MKNLGEKLKSARESLGLSMRDASEATRIRTDFIENMESGNFTFNLPEIYKRGFLRIYAKFLKLDVDAIMAEYIAGSSVLPVEEQKRKHILTRKPVKIDPEIIEHPSRYENELQEESLEEKKPSNDEQMRQYLKLGSVFVGVLLGVVVLVSLISAIMRPSAPKENPEIALNSTASTAGVNADISTTPEVKVMQPFDLTIKALADTYATVYYEDDTQKPLFSGALEAGATKTFSSKKTIMLILTDADKVELTRTPNSIKLPANITGYRKVRVTDGAK